MRTLFSILLVLMASLVYSQNIRIVDFNELEKQLSTNSDSTFVINFWATWCKPCVEELPDFFKVENNFKNEKFQLILVSLDFSTHLDTRVKPFIEKNNITSEVIILDDPDANTWINKVDKNWDGSIPATIVFNKSKRLFIDKTISYEDLNIIVEDMVN